MNQNIIIFRDHLLKRSETFILSQAEKLKDFTPYYVGSRKMNQLLLPKERTITANGRLREMAFRLFGYASPFIRQVKNLNPVLIHAHFGPDGVLALPIARALQIPLIVTFGGYDATVDQEVAMKHPLYDRHRIYFQKEMSLKHEARLFLTVSDFIKRKVLKRGFPPDNVIVHYTGVDTQVFRPNAAIQRQPLVLFVGRLVEVKGCEYLLRAMKNVEQQAPNAQLVIVGDGPLRSSLEKLARSEQLANYRFTGWQSHQEVREWLNRARVCCSPSIIASSGAEEGFSNAILEAMACGLPVVSFCNGGTPEAVEHGKTGFLAKEKNIDELSSYIIRLLKDQPVWNEFSDAALNRVRSTFDLCRQTKKLEDIYRSVVAYER
ncbi:MAG: glycosyl transferase [Acidobacteria bacterium]|nr:MAG: glycosyl transferase [Acidobacteriota bacterium]